MKYLYFCLFIFTLFSQVSCYRFSEPDKNFNPANVLWYDEPASEWTEALPLGNGRIGAMVYGGTDMEIIQFNEETLWSGQPHDYTNKNAYRNLDTIRKLLWDGKQVEAHKLGNENFMSQPLGQMSYLPFGNVLLNFPGHEEVTAYKRILNLEEGLSVVYYEVDNIKFKREMFITEPDQSLVIRLESSEKGALNFNVALSSPHSEYDILVEGNQIILKGKARNYSQEKSALANLYPESKLSFEARLIVANEGGRIIVHEKSLEIADARNASLYLVAATNFINYNDISGNPTQACTNDLASINRKSFKTLKDEHIRDFSSFLNRSTLDLGSSEISGRTTDERLNSFNTDEDPCLVALLFQYGRYLLISSSRPGTQPANLQGIWNDKLTPPWDSKYTININTEMNYWPAEMTNLSDCAGPLFSLVEDISNTGRNVAREHYNLDGWVTHHNTDIWRGAAPINNANHGVWPTGGAWLSQHLFWHYEYTGDKEFLEKRTYPVLKEASRFFINYLVPYPENSELLVSGPSNSPELGGMVMGPTMDHQIIRNLFSNTIEAAEILGIDENFAEELKKKRAKIAPNQIGKHGQLQEWLEDMDNPSEKHRHVSHLWGLHPGNEIHPLINPGMAEACKVTLSHRGDGGTGWSRAWKINFWARLLDGDHAYLLLKNLMVPSISRETNYTDKGGLYLNLFDAHPPFQIDGNFGATSGIVEMLLQSHLRDENGDFFQDILPALPSKLPNGNISGIKGRGNFEFVINWEKGILVSLRVKSFLGNKLNLRYNGKTISRETITNRSYTFKVADFQ